MLKQKLYYLMSIHWLRTRLMKNTAQINIETDLKRKKKLYDDNFAIWKVLIYRNRYDEEFLDWLTLDLQRSIQECEMKLRGQQ